MKECEHFPVDLILTPELTHYGKYICCACGKFMGWASKPENLERQKANAEALDKLGRCDLNNWEKGFVLSLTKQGAKLSPRQQELLDKLLKAYLTT